MNSRINLSRTLRVFSLKQIADGWEFSLSTLNRYNSPHYRQISVVHGRNSYVRYRAGIVKNQCYNCKETLIGHQRCQDCTILLHNPGARFCRNCFDVRFGSTVEDTDPYDYGISL